MGAEALEKVSLYWLCHLPEAGALQIRRIGELAGSFREAYYIEETQYKSVEITFENISSSTISSNFGRLSV